MKDPFYKYSSKIDKLIVPLTKFTFFHKPSEPGHINPVYIQNKKNYYKLRNWLLDNTSKGGSYLITGYRGAGKSSFVGTVLYDLFIEGKIKNARTQFENSKKALSGFSIFWQVSLLLIFILIQPEENFLYNLNYSSWGNYYTKLDFHTNL